MRYFFTNVRAQSSKILSGQFEQDLGEKGERGSDICTQLQADKHQGEKYSEKYSEKCSEKSGNKSSEKYGQK